ncbi:hypothetical protein ACFLT7_05515, partial [candidate division KSB1 bacterium]
IPTSFADAQAEQVPGKVLCPDCANEHPIGYMFCCNCRTKLPELVDQKLTTGRIKPGTWVRVTFHYPGLPTHLQDLYWWTGAIKAEMPDDVYVVEAKLVEGNSESLTFIAREALNNLSVPVSSVIELVDIEKPSSEKDIFQGSVFLGTLVGVMLTIL